MIIIIIKIIINAILLIKGKFKKIKMIQHLSQSASKGRNLKTKERIQSAKITLQRKQFSLSFKVKAVEDFQTEKRNFPKVTMGSFLKNLDCGDGETLNE